MRCARPWSRDYRPPPPLDDPTPRYLQPRSAGPAPAPAPAPATASDAATAYAATSARAYAAASAVPAAAAAPNTATAAAARRGKAVQVDPIKPTLKAPATKRLKLKYDNLRSNFAFHFNLRRYAARACLPAPPSE